MPISHVSLATGASMWKAMRSFYLDALTPLNYVVYYEKENEMLGLRPQNGEPDFWLHVGNGEQPAYENGDVKNRPGRAHIAFDVESREVVDKFFTAATKAGGAPNGDPGLRPYADGYYAAFVLDPLGNNIEAIHFKPKKQNLHSTSD
ncbi:hypothetical protein JX265_001973 [Neoarthrinium moseri]|uniref:VOC domain-containing protein n=1 Tax=Neoarthrinium moseri TaxID=1658444 RepID=A0A9Q0AUC8_9PEZI|nr:hypothetical protein JX266_006081 [Neoarthrinium moseri]KAI1880352.1 hypothetical protein JX265_001973 [Neoarthrinium moseri]